MAPRIITLATIIIAVNLFGAAHIRTASQSNSSSSVEDPALSRLPAPYRSWLTEDVPYIITNEERKIFLRLADDDERDRFIEQFWQRRSPAPGSEENLSEEEHYRRIAYSNEHFSTDLPGWRSDRGRIYIAWGPPEEVRADSATPQQTSESLQIWRYRYLEGIGENVEVTFSHIQDSHNYQLTVNSKLAAALFDMAKGVGSYTDPRTAPVPPVPGFKALEAVVVAHLIRNTIAFDHRVEFVSLTHFTTAVALTIEIPKLEFHRQTALPNETPGLNVFCRISNASGRIVEGFYERVLQADAAPQDSAGLCSLRRSVLLRAGSYAIAIVVNDPRSGDVGTVYTTLNVPPLTTQE
jgi:GWxTD domain-containing protein